MHYPVWVNGSDGGKVDPADRGIAYGDGLFESLLVRGGKAILLDEHLDRLEAGAAALGLDLEMSLLAREVEYFIAQCPASCVAKITITRGVTGRSYLPDPKAVPTRIMSAYAPPEWPSAHADSGIDAVVCSFKLSIQPVLAGLKHLNRLEQVLLRRELAERHGAEGLVCDFHGRVVEGVFSNIFMVRNGYLATPLINQAGVRGVMRDSIIRQSQAEGIAVVEGSFSVEDFCTADEVFFCNSVYGVWPVRSLLGRSWSPGPVTRRWQSFWHQKLG